MSASKRHLSKWTAVQPRNKEKHFKATQLLRNEEENVVEVVIEAIHSHRELIVPWQSLRDGSVWKLGWQYIKALS